MLILLCKAEAKFRWITTLSFHIKFETVNRVAKCHRIAETKEQVGLKSRILGGKTNIFFSFFKLGSFGVILQLISKFCPKNSLKPKNQNIIVLDVAPHSALKALAVLAQWP